MRWIEIWFMVLGIVYSSQCIVLGAVTPKFSTLQHQKTLQNKMLDGYKKTLRPISDQDLPLTVNISFKFHTIQNYNEVSGLFAFNGGLNLSWVDESIRWNPNEYGNATVTRLPIDDIWVPNIGVRNPAESEEFMEIEIAGFTVPASNHGLMDLQNSGMIKIMCEPDVTYYPFDIHHCSLTLAVLNYESYEVQLQLAKPAEAMHTFTENGQWSISILDTIVTDKTMEIKLEMKRKSSFLIVNLFLPVLFLLSINMLVFLLPVKSGERISFSITSFLSFAVFITILTEKVPQQSNPLSILSIIFAFQLANSTMILICNVLVINIYHRSYDVLSSCIVAFVRFMGQKSHGKMSSSAITIRIKPAEDCCKSCEEVVDEKVTWKEVAYALDKLFLLIFLCSTMFPVIVFIFYVTYKT
ncbi:neuronal acetylcholine receptor subunit alpha-6-like [Saccostrea echinata]|uniref:neuronal acetylcholine receptor subunit alpha-6-like n=1 Tax=Saccostrea echinata TaxID=191078 RepID=UPI002A81FF7A|nr:neuronal acetylcholine receptor subunit alpha-6-like [Saccostrea echinata]